jgi:site-specific recombinase XerD
MMSDSVAAFLAWSERDRLRSPATLARYRTVLAQLPDPLGAGLEEVQAWWDSRLDKSAATRANDLACLRSFYRWATRRDLRADDPTRLLDAPKVDNAFPRPIGRSDLQRALDACEEAGLPELRRAICLGAYGGLRVSEAAALDWAEVDLDRRFLRIRGKGRKERLAGLSPRLLDEILPARPRGNVVTAGGEPYSAAALQRRVNRYLASLGLDSTFHKLRARYVTQGIAETGDIYAVSRAVGWASIETAKHYAALSDDALHRIAAAAGR